MKARVIVIEADDVSAADVGEVLGKVFGGFAQSDTPAALPPAPVAALPKPRSNGHARRRMTAEEELAEFEAQQDAESEVATAPAKRPKAGPYICAGCGADKPAGLRGPRPKCPKCGSTAWEPTATEQRPQ